MKKHSGDNLIFGDKLRNEKDYWIDKLSDEIEMSGFQTNRQITGDEQYKKSMSNYRIYGDIFRRIIEISNKSEYGIYTILLSGVKYLIYRYTGSQNITVGVPPIKNNNGVKPINHLLPFNIRIKDNSSFKEYLSEISQTLGKVIKYQNFPLKSIINLCDTSRNSRYLAFRTVVLLENIHDHKCLENSSVDMVFVFNISNMHIDFNIEYNSLLYEQSDIQQISRHFINYIKFVLNNVQTEIADIDIMSKQEKQQILYEFNNTDCDYPCNKTIHKLFEEQVEKIGDNIAAEYEEKKLTYKELNNKSNQLARLLRRNGVKTDSIVCIMVERSLEMIVGIMGILKAGAAYLPIDPEYPEERIRYMIKDSNSQIMLTHKGFDEKYKLDIDTIKLDNEEIYSGDANNLEVLAKSTNLAYVIYTSGSTGNPKGVMIEHKSVINRLKWMQKAYPINKKDKILQKTPFTFDVSVWELFWWAFEGTSVCFLEPNGEKDSYKIAKAIRQYRITTMHFVPSMLTLFLEHSENENNEEMLKSLKYVFASGEALKVHQVKRFNKILYKANKTKLINLYGPTEATVDVSHYDCSGIEDIKTVPIGKSIDNTKFYVVDKFNNLQPVGVAGELCILGECLARGYMNKPELTAEKFILNPYVKGGRMYRTGDLVRWCIDGNIEFLGRIDHQIKIRGYRIELGEIEKQILKYEGVDEAIVIADGEDENKQLYAYIVSKIQLDMKKLKMFIASYLPDYMVPSFFMKLDKIYTNTNGKIDRNKLPKPNIRLLSHKEYEAPSNNIEKELVDMWGELLNIEGVGINDNFIELGGNSLIIMKLILKIHKKFSVTIPLSTLVELTNIKNTAQYVKTLKQNSYKPIEIVERREFYPASSEQKRMFILNQFSPNSTAYNIPFAFLIEGNLKLDNMEETLKKLVSRHDSLRTSFHIIDGEIVQKVHDDINFEICISNHNGSDLSSIIHNFIKPFNLTNTPLLRIEFVKISQCKYYMMLDIHHIITDAISMQLFFYELTKIYEGNELSNIKIQYKDYSTWQRELFQWDIMKSQEEYWLEVYKAGVPELNMQLDSIRKPNHKYTGECVHFELNGKIVERLKSFVSKNKTTIYIVLFAAYNLVLSKYTGKEDIVVGVPIAGRNHMDLENTMGIFVNTLAIRNFPSKEKSIIEFINEVSGRCFKAYENQDYQFEDLVDKLAVTRDFDRNPIFDTMFNLLDEVKVNLTGLNIKPYKFERGISLFDIQFEVELKDSQIYFMLNYNSQIYRRETMQRLKNDYIQIVEKIMEDKNSKIEHIMQ